jgi:hypothetical protein
VGDFYLGMFDDIVEFPDFADPIAQRMQRF